MAWTPGSPNVGADGYVSGSFSISPSDTATFDPPSRGLHVDVAGNLKVTFVDGTTDTFVVNAGSVYPYAVKQVFATGTTATGIHGLK